MQQKINATTGAITAVLNALVLLAVIELSAEQIAGINVAIGMVLLAVAGWFSPNIPVGKRNGQ